MPEAARLVRGRCEGRETGAAVVLGLDSHGLAVVRALADGGVPVYAVEKDLSLPGVVSNRPRAVFAVRSFNEQDLVPALEEIRQRLAHHEQVALLANNDRHVGLIAKFRNVLGKLYRVAWIDSADVIVSLQRKSELEAHCIRQGLNYPRSALFTSADQAALAQGFRYPMIIKPVQPLSSFKTLIANDQPELAALLQRQKHDLPILGQEYVPGDDSCIYFGALMLDRGRVIGRMAGRKLASFPPARGQTTIAETVDAPDVLELTERFFAGLELSGPVSLELKRDERGDFWVIEPTVGRTDFWAQLCISAGFNQPLMEYQLATGQAVSASAPIAQSVWLDTERDPVAYFSLCRRERALWPSRKRPVFPYWWHGDLRPAWVGVRRLIAARLRKPGR